MKLAMAQMRMDSMEGSNLNKTLYFMEEAKRAGADLIFFPELQLSPFFPQYEKRNADAYLQKPEDPAVQAIQRACRALGLYASPNIYLSLDGKSYDASLFIFMRGTIIRHLWTAFVSMILLSGKLVLSSALTAIFPPASVPVRSGELSSF